MEYRSVSAKLPSNELTMFKSFCEKKGVTPASLIREMILKELELPIPHTIAGNNKIIYDKETDTFSWRIELDNGEVFEILKRVSPSFIEDLLDILTIGINERCVFIRKKKKGSIPIPSDILRGDKC